MKLINAQIQTRDELYERLLKDEVFYIDSHKVHHDPNALDHPFRIGQHPLFTAASRFKDFTMLPPTHWHEDLKYGPILCKVGDTDYALIADRREGHYYDVDGNPRHSAEPVSPDDSIIWSPKL